MTQFKEFYQKTINVEINITDEIEKALNRQLKQGSLDVELKMINKAIYFLNELYNENNGFKDDSENKKLYFFIVDILNTLSVITYNELNHN